MVGALVVFFSLVLSKIQSISLDEKLNELLLYTVVVVMERHWYLGQTNVCFKHSDLTLLFFQNHNREQSCLVNHTSQKMPPAPRASFIIHSAAEWATTSDPEN